MFEPGLAFLMLRRTSLNPAAGFFRPIRMGSHMSKDDIACLTFPLFPQLGQGSDSGALRPAIDKFRSKVVLQSEHV